MKNAQCPVLLKYSNEGNVKELRKFQLTAPLQVPCVPCVPSTVSSFQEHLDAFVAAVNSEFGCLLVMGKVAVATERW